jgi:hypothetical protein
LTQLLKILLATRVSQIEKRRVAGGMVALDVSM